VERLADSLDGQRRPIANGPTIRDGGVDGLSAGVVWDAGVVHIDGHALKGEAIAPARLSEADDEIWGVEFDEILKDLKRLPEDRGQLLAHEVDSGELLGIDGAHGSL
jgi:hypothetical protein